MRSAGNKRVVGKGGITLKIDIEQLKTLVESGDKTALESHIYTALEKEDVALVQSVNSDVRSALDTEKDKHHNKALETWKTNNLKGLIDDAVAKANPTETPEQKRIRELEEKIANNEKREKVAELKEKALEHVTNNGLPLKFATKYISRFLEEDETVTTSTLDELKNDLDALVTEQVEAKFKDNGRDIDKGGSGSTGTIKSITEMAAEHNIRNQN